LANHDARPYTESWADTLENLSLHLVKPVQWRATIQCLLENRVGYAIELGPKNILGYLLDKSTKEISGLSLDKEMSWAAFRSDWVIDEDDVLRVIEKCLGAIASTKNECRDLDIYELEIVKPTNVLRSLLGDLRSGKAPISKSHLEPAIGIANSVLAAKQAPGREIARRHTEVLGPGLFELRSK
jgi:[acyl-carrier-protein] S-malonyltransferase